MSAAAGRVRGDPAHGGAAGAEDLELDGRARPERGPQRALGRVPGPRRQGRGLEQQDLAALARRAPRRRS